MFQGNWPCSGCGKAITELPFEPRRTDGLKCRDCFSGNKGGNSGSRPQRRDGEERRMFEGNWKCSMCGEGITKLPFMPKDESNLKCINCFKKDR
jgi:CxxC-x17-CxxC domain-containing protein